MTKIFGGEPAAILGVLQAVLAMIVSLEWFDLTAEESALILAATGAVLGLVTAFVTRDSILAAMVAAINAVAALLVGYGLELTENQIATFVAVVSAVAALYQRTQTEPLESATLANGAAAGPRYGTVAPGGQVTT